MSRPRVIAQCVYFGTWAMIAAAAAVVGGVAIGGFVAWVGGPLEYRQ